MSNAARDRGHKFERDTVNELIKRGWEACTSRYSSRKLDDAGVDIDSNYPFQIQCKATVKQPQIWTLLETTDATAIFYRRIEKHGGRFYQDGEYVTVKMDAFLDLVDKAYKNK
jgi:Holliday junction resolvase